MKKFEPPIATFWNWREGVFHIWRKGLWVVQLFHPHYNPRVRGLYLDSAFRVDLRDRGAGVVVLGFGVGVSTRPHEPKLLLNDGLCAHGVSLKRECADCHESVATDVRLKLKRG